jgi:hypothetical protein
VAVISGDLEESTLIKVLLAKAFLARPLLISLETEFPGCRSNSTLST